MVAKKNKNKPSLIIVDSYALIFRSYFALEKMQMRTSKTNEPTWAVYGYFKTLFSVIDDNQPDYLIAAWDARGKTFRDAIDSEYKQNRPPAPDDLPVQINRVEEILSVLKIPKIEMMGYEADDVIGTLAKQAIQSNIDVKIVTLDKDLLQLIEPGITVQLFRPYQGDFVLYDDKQFIENYGFGPLTLIDYKAIVGDKSDNIKGVKGLGDKGAKKLIETWGNIENIYANIEEVQPERTKKLLMENKNDAFTAKKLATIEIDVPELQIDLESAQYGNYIFQEVKEKFDEVEFHSLIEKLPGSQHTMAKATQDDLKVTVEYIQFNDMSKITSALHSKQNISMLYIDQQMKGCEPELVGLGVSIEGDRAFYIELSPENAKAKNEENAALIEFFSDLRNIEINVITHDAKKLIKMLDARLPGVKFPKIQFDTLLADYLLGFTNSSLENIIIREISADVQTEEELFGSGKNQVNAFDLSKDVLSQFICGRARLLFALKQQFTKSLEEIELLDILHEVDMPHLEVLSKMELQGIGVDKQFLLDLSVKLEKSLSGIEKTIYKHAGHDFLISSPKQLASVLFEELSLPKTKKNKTSWSTDAQALDSIASSHPIIREILQWRELMKIKTTYADALPDQISQISGNIHTMFSQTSMTTGRLTSNDPNLQNIPVRSEIGREIRKAFITSNKKNNLLVSFDYSQIELRVLAHLSKDKSLIQSFIDGRDIHTETASKLFDISAGQVQDEHRRAAKVFNFGIIYGLSAHGLMQRQHIARDEAEQLIENYFAAYPGVNKWKKKIIKDASSNGFVETLLGRRRYIPNITSQNKNLQLAAERIAINMPVQGTAADIIKQAMNDIDKELTSLQEEGLRSTMLLQIHDELIFDVPEKEIDVITNLAERLMPSMILDVPLIIERKYGKSWGEMKADA
ncbi:MAG: DNA polymerase I [Chloroflexi bacterium]|nr:DNA polymerase I [Chloroflexota bacterium]